MLVEQWLNKSPGPSPSAVMRVHSKACPKLNENMAVVQKVGGKWEEEKVERKVDKEKWKEKWTCIRVRHCMADHVCVWYFFWKQYTNAN